MSHIHIHLKKKMKKRREREGERERERGIKCERKYNKPRVEVVKRNGIIIKYHKTSKIIHFSKVETQTPSFLSTDPRHPRHFK